MIIRTTLLLSSIVLIPIILAANYPTTCYVLDGTQNTAAGFRCDNETTGHSSCCGPGAVCYSNEVCKQQNWDVIDYLRVGCTDKTWQDTACLDQCSTYVNDSTAGIRFCNGSITSTTEYCCEYGDYGVGSFKCCQTASSIFNISPAPTVLAQMPLSQLSTTSTTASSASTTNTAAAATSPASTPASSSSDSSSHSAAIGAGIGVPLGILALAGVAFLFWRHRKKVKAQNIYEMNGGGRTGQGGEMGGAGVYHDADMRNSVMSGGVVSPFSEGQVGGEGGGEGWNGRKSYFGGREYEAVGPQELDGRRMHELG